ncbi:MAG: hypothetical protein ABSC31_01840 [Acidimicrobiales bacterium]|jgi:hypothetical protein
MARKRSPEFRFAGWATVDPEGFVNVGVFDLPWRIYVRVAEVGGVPQIVALRIEAGVLGVTEDREHLVYEGDDDPTITADVLRRLPLRQLRAVAVREAYQPESDWLEPFRIERVPGQAWPDEHYQEVAEVYRSSAGKPLLAIAERWKVSRPTASKWVAEARRRKFLKYPSRPGVAGASRARSPIKRQRSQTRRSGS